MTETYHQVSSICIWNLTVYCIAPFSHSYKYYKLLLLNLFSYVKNTAKDTNQWQIWLSINNTEEYLLSFQLFNFHKLSCSVSNTELDIKFRLGWCARLDIEGDILITAASGIASLSHFKHAVYFIFVHKQVTDISTSLQHIILKGEENTSICLGIFLPQAIKIYLVCELFSVDRQKVNSLELDPQLLQNELQIMIQQWRKCIGNWFMVLLTARFPLEVRK